MNPVDTLRIQRGESKRIFLQHAHAVLRDLESTADHIRESIGELKGHEITEAELMEEIYTQITGILVTVGFSELNEKYVNFRLRDHELKTVLGATQ